MTHSFTVIQSPAVHTTASVAADVTAVSIAGATFLGYLPSIAAILSIIWLSMQIISTVDRWIHRKEYRRKFTIVPDDPGDKFQD